LIAFLLTACGGEEAPTENPDAVMTSAVGTMVASFFDAQTAAYTPPAPTPLPTLMPPPSLAPILSTVTLGPTPTPTFIYYSPTPGTITPTGTLTTATVDPASLAFGCNNLAFIRDVNIPSGTTMEARQGFTKTWKVQNTGTCDWAFNYILVNVGGEKMEAETGRISKKVPVWSWSEVSVDMIAPAKPGTYTSSWRLSDGTNLFGATLVVSIVVKDVEPTLAPTSTPTFTPPPTATPTFTETPTSTATPTATPG
jgi:hypothetical protein